MKAYRRVELYLHIPDAGFYHMFSSYVERDISDCIKLAVQPRKNICS